MIATISLSGLRGNILAPASKSTMQRACALALLNHGKTTIKDPGKSNDDLAAIDIISRLGVVINNTGNNEIIIESNGEIKAPDIINCAESGLSLRMFAPIIALSEKEVQVIGKGSLLTRPVDSFENVFPLLQVKIKTHKGFLPVNLKGPLQPVNINIDGSSGSQYLTGLLFSFARSVKKEVSIFVEHLTSRPYIDLSLQMLQHFGYDVCHNGYEEFIIKPVDKIERNIIYQNEGDWSNSAFLLVAGAISGNVVIKGLKANSVQGDRAIIEVLKKCGADISVHEKLIVVTNANKLIQFNFDATQCPDLFPPLVALAACCEGTSVITGTSRLLIKESNRAQSLVDVFTRLGIKIKVENDKLYITGGEIKGATVSGHQDHRIVMAAAVAGLKADHDVIIMNAEAVNKSYPGFFKDLQTAGGNVSLSER